MVSVSCSKSCGREEEIGEIIPIYLRLCFHFLRTVLTLITISILFSIYGPENCIFPPKYYLHITRLGMKMNYFISLNYINYIFYDSSGSYLNCSDDYFCKFILKHNIAQDSEVGHADLVIVHTKS